jgi:hypothetical protein
MIKWLRQNIYVKYGKKNLWLMLIKDKLLKIWIKKYWMFNLKKKYFTRKSKKLNLWCCYKNLNNSDMNSLNNKNKYNSKVIYKFI